MGHQILLVAGKVRLEELVLQGVLAGDALLGLIVQQLVQQVPRQGVQRVLQARKTGPRVALARLGDVILAARAKGKREECRCVTAKSDRGGAGRGKAKRERERGGWKGGRTA